MTWRVAMIAAFIEAVALFAVTTWLGAPSWAAVGFAVLLYQGAPRATRHD